MNAGEFRLIKFNYRISTVLNAAAVIDGSSWEHN